MDMIRYSEYPILPIESLVKIGNGKSLGKSLSLLFDHCRRTLIVTAGELGCLIYDGDNLNMIPAIKLQAVDTTGAGDIYRGAFAYGLVRQVSLVECAKFANTVSALQCTKLGNVDAIPTKQEIEEFGNLPNQIRKVNLSQVDNYFCELNKTL
jgi:sugar/nucleoside kinase (ribokinase family)